MSRVPDDVEKHTSDDKLSNTMIVRNGLDADIEVFSPTQDLLVGEGCKTKLLQRIIRVRDQFPKEDIPS